MASAGGQSEQPSDVNSSTMIGTVPVARVGAGLTAAKTANATRTAAAGRTRFILAAFAPAADLFEVDENAEGFNRNERGERKERFYSRSRVADGRFSTQTITSANANAAATKVAPNSHSVR